MPTYGKFSVFMGYLVGLEQWLEGVSRFVGIVLGYLFTMQFVQLVTPFHLSVTSGIL